MFAAFKTGKIQERKKQRSSQYKEFTSILHELAIASRMRDTQAALYALNDLENRMSQLPEKPMFIVVEMFRNTRERICNRARLQAERKSFSQSIKLLKETEALNEGHKVYRLNHHTGVYTSWRETDFLGYEQGRRAV